jgi:hypothetical protein
MRALSETSSIQAKHIRRVYRYSISKTGKSRAQYSVISMQYASIQGKERLLGGEIPTFKSQVVYIGPSERIALYLCGRACIGDELAYSVTLKRAGATIAEVKPVRPL